MSKLTEIDLVLATAYFPILIQVAKDKDKITYGQLVETAKELNPDNPTVQNAIPVSTGRRLDVVRAFTNTLNCPDLTSLVINQSEGECGGGFTRTFNPEIVRAEVLSHNWDDINWEELKSGFAGFISATEKKIKPRKKKNHGESTKLMSAHWYTLPKEAQTDELRAHRDYLIEMIMEGFDPEEAFQECIDRIKSESSASK